MANGAMQGGNKCLRTARMQLPRKMSVNVMASITRSLGNRGEGNTKHSNEVKLAGEESKDKLYEPKHRQKVVRVLTVLAYVVSVSLAAIILSLYYSFIWDPKDHALYTIRQTSLNSTSKVQCLNVTIPVVAEIPRPINGSRLVKIPENRLVADSIENLEKHPTTNKSDEAAPSTNVMTDSNTEDIEAASEFAPFDSWTRTPPIDLPETHISEDDRTEETELNLPEKNNDLNF